MRERSIGLWHSMITGYAVNRQGDEGMLLFEQMRNSGLEPDKETFLVALAACASAEAVEEGFALFESMKNEYEIVPEIEHYLGLIDVLGKSGHLNEVEEDAILAKWSAQEAQTQAATTTTSARNNKRRRITSQPHNEQQAAITIADDSETVDGAPNGQTRNNEKLHAFSSVFSSRSGSQR
jgi:pentatricopeptide repeat protein